MSQVVDLKEYRRHSKECMWRQWGHFYMVFNVNDSEGTRGKGEAHVALQYIEYESPVCYCGKVMCRVKVFFKYRSKVTVKVT